MWTPKRTLVALAGFILLFSAFRVYAHFLGGIDGLPPLPRDYWPRADHTDPELPISRPPNPADTKLCLAFGEQSQVLGRAMKLEIRNRRMVVAADQIDILKEGEREGQVMLKPCAIALFGKDPGPAQEINTISSGVAYLTFDKPVSEIRELGDGRKIIAAELQADQGGDIQIANNRKTVNRDDDLFLVTKGPVYYDESKHLIWTKEHVHITDQQSKPQPTELSGLGMDVELATEPPPAAPREERKPAPQSVSGVKKVTLNSAVDMYLWVDANSGFLNSDNASAPRSPTGKDAPKSKVSQASQPPAAARTPTPNAPNAPPAKSKVVINTAGPFVYDALSERAIFDILASGQRSSSPNNVVVTRKHEEEGKQDQLICDHLEIQFRRKNAAGAGASEDREKNLEIASAHATGVQVTLTSDAEGLLAYGDDLFYDAQKHQSILKGQPMKAEKERNQITASNLCLDGTGEKEIRKARVNGPGRIDMLDHATDKLTLHAVWKDELIFAKDNDFDCLTLIGDAVFLDDDHKQEIRAQRLKVWFKSAEGNKPAASGPQRARPYRLEAVGNVTAQAPELLVQGPTEHLVIWFKDRPEKPVLPPPTPERGDAAGAAKDNATDKTPGPAPGRAPGPEDKTASAPPAKPKQPIKLSARSVDTHVSRVGEKNDLEKVWCEGNVHVVQDPSGPEDKGVDILGDTLQLEHFVEGNVLVVTGNLAVCRFDKMTIQGPEVNIDQKTNNAWVHGLGAMQMPASQNLNGEPLDKPGELTVHWAKDMFFNGNCAEFHGDVQAEQGTGRLKCQEMQVFLDRPVSFREGEKRTQPAKVKSLVCDKNVQVEDVVREGNRLVKFSRLRAPEVSVDNEEGVIKAPGPGVATVLQLGTADDPLAPPQQPGKPAAPTAASAKDKKEEMKLTRVNYQGHLHANNKTHIAIFYDGVEVIHVPTENPDLVVDPERPPPGCLNLRCEQLKVFKGPDGQEMEARKQARVQSQEFWGVAEVITYNESKDQVIFVGGEGGSATLWRVRTPGGPQEKITGKKISYIRRTGDVRVEGGSEIDGIK